jgi:hypothetical protein
MVGLKLLKPDKPGRDAFKCVSTQRWYGAAFCKMTIDRNDVMRIGGHWGGYWHNNMNHGYYTEYRGITYAIR